MNKIALITGVSSGIGRSIAQLLTERDVRVFGTVRDPKTVSPIPTVELIQMDVASDLSVNSGIKRLLGEASSIDYLINSAGSSIMGAIEETSIAEAKAQFDVNFFGVLRITNAVLPTMRQQGAGRIVNISSILGLIPGPFWGIYSASKHALEGYTESLDHEIRGFGVRALLVEPAYTKTSLGKNTAPAGVAMADYTAMRKRVTTAIVQAIESGDEPQLVANSVWSALTDKVPRLRYPVGKAATLSRLRRLVPANMFAKSLRKQFQID